MDEEDLGEAYSAGEEILLTLIDETIGGVFLGFLDEGIMVNTTYMAQPEYVMVTEEDKTNLRITFYSRDPEEITALAIRYGIPVQQSYDIDGQNALREQLIQARVEELENTLTGNIHLAEMKHGIKTFYPWTEIKRIQNLQDYLQEMEMRKFSRNIDDLLRED